MKESNPTAAKAPVLCCVGTRPELIKMAPVIHALNAQGGPGTAVVVNSGQHSAEVLAPLFDFFQIQVDHQLDVMRPGSSLASLNARLLSGFGELIAALRPRAVVVQGDTSSAFAAGFAAFLEGVPVGHVEAGLRTGDIRSPFPEECNRSLLGRFSDWHFAPTPAAAQRLRRELSPGTIQLTGNTIVDAVQWSLRRLEQYRPAQALEIGAALAGKRRLVVTMHRRENWGDGIRDVAIAVRQLLQARPELSCVWCLHPNPAVADTVRAVFDNLAEAVTERLALVAPLAYPDMLAVMRDADVLLSDSGGIQEESVSLRLPVLIARQDTERPEVVDCGAGRLVGTATDRVLQAVNQLLDSATHYEAMTGEVQNPFGDGRAGQSIAEALLGTA